MLLSMTGYGRATGNFQDKVIAIEVRALNSKHTDVRFKIPQSYREREANFRKIALAKAERGKIDLLMEVKSEGGDDEYGLNRNLFKRYYYELKELTDELGVSQGDIIQAVMRIPNVVSAEHDSIPDEEWEVVENTLKAALDKFINFRHTEGAAMEKDLQMRANNIADLLKHLNPHEEERVVRLRQRLKQSLEDHINKDKIDESRFEQEVLFYLEKMDVTEEKVRLGQHCKYFLEVMSKNNTQKGRKLSFISQEMGREINTLGAKAYSSEIQRIVVQMKDELEKIKEQVANCV
ncbi:MAG: YicC/YloC family endoribonuclease [Saprospiraceae bacterium]